MLADETVVNALVEKYRAIPNLVALFANQATNIYGYVDQWPSRTNLIQTVRDQPEGTLMIAYQETAAGQINRRETWRHRLSAFLKPAGKASDAWFWMVNGIPTNGDGLKMLYTESLHPALHRMNVPTKRRQFLTVDAANGVVIDYWEINITIDEKGD